MSRRTRPDRRRSAPAARARGDRGSESVELAILLPVGILVLAMLVDRCPDRAGRRPHQRCRRHRRPRRLAGPLSRRARSSIATASATAALAERNLHCADVRVTVDTSGFTPRPGRTAAITVAVTCTVDLSDIGVPGLPGSTDPARHRDQPARPCTGPVVTRPHADGAPRPDSAMQRDRGSVAVLFCFIVLIAGTLVTVPRRRRHRIQAANRADTYSAEAARAASIAIGPVPTGGTTPTHGRPPTAARAYLDQAGATGTVTVTGPGVVQVSVTVTDSTPRCSGSRSARPARTPRSCRSA